jgi:hypothetical protein
VIALLFAAFLIYLYAPHLVFKFAAGGNYGFVVGKHLPQVEEFFAAGLPSIVLNGMAWLFFRFGPLDHVVLDRAVVAALFTKDPELSAYVISPTAPAVITYIAVLFVTAWISGDLYGRALRAIALAGGSLPYFERSKGLSTFARAIVLLYRRLWLPFYSQFEQPLYPQVLQEPYAFVHTNKGLFHGILYQLDKARDGEIEGIHLLDVSKFSNKKEEDCFAAGENPIRHLTGPLFIKWSEILDINYPPDDSILKSKEKYYSDRLKKYSARSRTDDSLD